MQRVALAFCVSCVLGLVSCGGSASNPITGEPVAPTAIPPQLVSIAPSASTVGSPAVQLAAYGSNLENNSTIEWNGTALQSQCVDANLAQTSCTTAVALLATLPAADLAQPGTAQVSISNTDTKTTSNSATFTISPAPPNSTWVQAVGSITAPRDVVWDSKRGELYVSVGAADTSSSVNSIVAIDPKSAQIAKTVPAPSDPNQLSMSSDGSYIWAGLDGTYKVQRYLLPDMTPDISFQLPSGVNGSQPQQAVSLQAAPVSPHALGIVAGNYGEGHGIYVYDDAAQRPTSANAFVDWIQWGQDDSVLYGNQYTTIDEGGIATLPVNASGVTLGSYKGGPALQLRLPEFNRADGLLYSNGQVFDPKNPSLVGIFNIGLVEGACTADSTLNRYFCVNQSFVGGTDVSQFQLSVFDLKTYALLNSYSFGFSAGSSYSSITGEPIKVVRWGNAGLVVLTQTAAYAGNGGVFLIDGAAVNPAAQSDYSTGKSPVTYPSMTSMTPQAATVSSGPVNISITGKGFTPTSSACWSCNFIQERLLPTTYVSSTQLTVTVPVSTLPTNQPIEVSVYDSATNVFSTNALTFTVLPSSAGPTQFTPLNICGLGMAWDNSSKKLYVGTADYDAQFPNSIVAIDPTTGTVTKSAPAGADPMYLSVGAGSEYLYVANEFTTNMTQLTLPDLSVASVAVLAGASGEVYFPGDVKAAPVNPHTAAVTLLQLDFQPSGTGGLVVFDDNVPRAPFSLYHNPSTFGAVVDTLAWGPNDSILAATSDYIDGGGGPLYELSVNPAGLTYKSEGPNNFNPAGGILHSDSSTGLIYSDSGNVADPVSGTQVGTYPASGLAAPDSTLGRTFFLTQSQSQAGSNNYTIVSFDQKTYKQVSTLVLSNLSGSPSQMVRWGASGLAILTSGGAPDIYENGFGMLYIVQDSTFVSAKAAADHLSPQENYVDNWKPTHTMKKR